MKAKMEGRKITPPKAPKPTKPSDLMEALRQSAGGDSEARAEKRKAAPRKTANRKRLNAAKPPRLLRFYAYGWAPGAVLAFLEAIIEAAERGLKEED